MYTINYTCLPAELTNVSYTSASVYTVCDDANTTLKLAKTHPTPDASLFYDEATGDYTKTLKDVYNATLTNLDTIVTPYVANRYPYWCIFGMPSAFADMNTIVVPYNDDTVYAGNDTITFTTYKCVRFIVWSASSW